MQSEKWCSPSVFWVGLWFALGVGVLFAFGFLASVRALIEPLGLGDWTFLFATVLMSAGFAFSIPAGRPLPLPEWSMVRTAAPVSLFIPVLIAAIYGFARQSRLPSSLAIELTWTIAVVPVAEELIFRSWLYRLVERRWGSPLVNGNFPLPLPVLLTAVAFSCWHLQNYAGQPLLTIFEMVYTFFVGVWLARWRWLSGGLAYPIAAHTALNLGATLGTTIHASL